MEALNRQALRILRLFGNGEVKRVITSVGPEQEYFLVAEEMYERRRDLRLHGSHAVRRQASLKGQQLEEHYFGAISRMFPSSWPTWTRSCGSWA